MICKFYVAALTDMKLKALYKNHVLYYTVPYSAHTLSGTVHQVLSFALLLLPSKLSTTGKYSPSAS